MWVSHFVVAVEELTCLATWKDGNSRYLVGLVSHNHAISNEERYRCFVYEKILPSNGEFNPIHRSTLLCERGTIKTKIHLQQQQKTLFSSDLQHEQYARGHFILISILTKLSAFVSVRSVGGNSKDEYKLAQSGDATCNGLDSAEVIIRYSVCGFRIFFLFVVAMEIWVNYNLVIG